MLIERKKFDFRIYVLVKGVEPLEAYLCDEGLARFCTVRFQFYLTIISKANYKKPEYNNLKNLYMHLTNFSLNKNSDNYIAPEGE